MQIIYLINCNPKLLALGIDFSSDDGTAMVKLDPDLRSLLGDIQWSYTNDGSLQIMSNSPIDPLPDDLSLYGDISEVLVV